MADKITKLNDEELEVERADIRTIRKSDLLTNKAEWEGEIVELNERIAEADNLLKVFD